MALQKSSRIFPAPRKKGSWWWVWRRSPKGDFRDPIRSDPSWFSAGWLRDSSCWRACTTAATRMDIKICKCYPNICTTQALSFYPRCMGGNGWKQQYLYTRGSTVHPWKMAMVGRWSFPFEQLLYKLRGTRVSVLNFLGVRGPNSLPLVLNQAYIAKSTYPSTPW